jgi:hypothetical protein
VEKYFDLDQGPYDSQSLRRAAPGRMGHLFCT